MKDPLGQVLEKLGLAPETLAGRVAVVTGAGRGIGRETARALAYLGARVVIAELSDQGAATEQAISAAGGKALFVRTDVSQAGDVQALAQHALGTYGPVDLLINNAALEPVTPLLDMPLDDWDRVVAVNLRGAFLTCRAFLPGMLEKRSGVIINMVSAEALPYMAAYVATKQGLVGFSQSLAGEVGEQGVRVIAFGPGMVDSPGIRAAAAGLAPRMGLSVEQFLKLSLHPAYEGLMPVEDCAGATVYLAARLAQQYAGDLVDAYEVLELAGYLQLAALEAPAAAEPSTMPVAQGPGLLEWCHKFETIIADTASEIEHFPVIVRPLVRQGIRAKSGKSLQEWQQVAGRLVRLARTSEDGPASRESLRSSCPGLRPLLQKLSTYYAEAAEQMARFTKDPSVLQEGARIAAQRQEVIRNLQIALELAA